MRRHGSFVIRCLARCAALPLLLALIAGCASDGVWQQRVARYRPEVSRPSVRSHEEKPGPSSRQLPEKSGSAREEPSSRVEGGSSSSLQRGDRVMIYLRGIPESEDIKDIIDEQGRVNLPFIGNVKISGLDTAEAEQIIEKKYVEGGYYNAINVILVAQEDQYFVRGEVKAPGRYPLQGDLTLLQAISTAGGYTDFARKNRIKVIRGEEVLFFDVEKIEEMKQNDPQVRPGDVIIVLRRIW